MHDVTRAVDAREVDRAVRLGEGHQLVALGSARVTARRVVGQVQAEQRLTVPLDAISGGPDHHPVGGLARARWREAALAVDLDEAHAAAAGRIEPAVVAERRDVDADSSGGIDEQRPIGDLERDVVDGEADHVDSSST
jgi:hypothetical protein